MRFKETREDLDPKKAAKQKAKAAKKSKGKKKSKKFEWKATVVSGTSFVKDKTKKTKEEIKKLRIAAFASTKIMWRPYALMIADYFNWEYLKNFSFIFDKLKTFNTKKKLTKKDMDELEVLVSINELKYYIKDSNHPKEIDINDELINRDFFVSDLDEEIYKGLIQESDSKYGHSISYLLKIYDLLISFVKEKETKEVFYKTVVLKEHQEMDEENHPVVINEKVINILPVNKYLSNKYNKKLRYKYDN